MVVNPYKSKKSIETNPSFFVDSVDGWNPAPVDFGSLSHYL